MIPTAPCGHCRMHFATRQHWGRVVIRTHHDMRGQRCRGSMKAAWVDPSERWRASA